MSPQADQYSFNDNLAAASLTVVIYMNCFQFATVIEHGEHNLTVMNIAKIVLRSLNVSPSALFASVGW